MKRIILNFFVIFLLSYCSCKSGTTKKNKSEPVDTIQPKEHGSTSLTKDVSVFTYDVNHPSQRWILPDPLVEVSGNTWIDANHLILIEDLHPNLYYIKLDNNTAILEKTVPFAPTDNEKIDIEDVTYLDNTVYALWSHGVLFKVSDWQKKPEVEQFNTGLKKENNTEGLCYDPVTRNLLIACKDDAGQPEEKKSVKAVYQFDLDQKKLLPDPFMLIRKKEFESVTGKKINFNPSAIAVHPVTHDVYILTTRDNKGMAIFSHHGVLKSYQEIEKTLMPQPEGICFSPDGKLFISSEGKQGEPGNLFEFDSIDK